jgi:hypothetical protein
MSGTDCSCSGLHEGSVSEPCRAPEKSPCRCSRAQ